MNFFGQRAVFVAVLSISIVTACGLYIRKVFTYDPIDDIIPKSKLLHPFRICPSGDETMALAVVDEGSKLDKYQWGSEFIYDKQNGLTLALRDKPIYFDFNLVATSDSDFKTTLESVKGGGKGKFYIKLVKMKGDRDGDDEGRVYYVQKLNLAAGATYEIHASTAHAQIFTLIFIPSKEIAQATSSQFKLMKDSELIKPSAILGAQNTQDDFWICWDSCLLPSSSTDFVLANSKNGLNLLKMGPTLQSYDFELRILKTKYTSEDNGKVQARIRLKSTSCYLDRGDNYGLKLVECKLEREAPILELCNLSAIPNERLSKIFQDFDNLVTKAGKSQD